MSSRLATAVAVFCVIASNASAAQWMAGHAGASPGDVIAAARASEAARARSTSTTQVSPTTAVSNASPAAQDSAAAAPVEGQMSCAALAAELMVTTGDLQRHQAAVVSRSRQMSRDAAASVPRTALASVVPGAGLVLGALSTVRSMADRASGDDPQTEINAQLAEVDQSNLDLAQAAERASRLGDIALAQGC